MIVKTMTRPAIRVASQEKLDTTNESGLRHIVTSEHWAPKHKAQTKGNTMYGTVLTKTNLLKLIPCAILFSNSPYLIYYHFSGKTILEPGVTFQFTVKLNIKSTVASAGCL